MTRIHNIQAGHDIVGMCYFSGRLYTTESCGDIDEVGDDRYRVAVYSVNDQENVTLLDTLDLEVLPIRLCIDRQSGQIYFSSEYRGIYVMRYDCSKLVTITTLRCVKSPLDLAVVSPDILYVCDSYSDTVCLVDVTRDRIITRLQHPEDALTAPYPFTIAVVGDRVLVGYQNDSLFIYRHGVTTPDTALPSLHLQGLEFITSLTTDHHSSFLLVDEASNTLFVLDISGNVTHTISVPGNGKPGDCTVVEGQLWFACENGNIIVMSSL